MKRAILVLTFAAIALSISAAVTSAATVTSEVANVPASMGGFLNSSNGQMQLQVPAGASSNSFTIKYTPKTTGDFPVTPPNTIWAGNPFLLEFLSGGDSIGALDTTATLVVTYNPSDLGGRSESAIQLEWLEPDGITWGAVPATLDTTKHTVTAGITEPGNYGLAVSNVAPAPAPAPTAAPAPTQAPAPTAVPAPAPVAPKPAPAPPAPAPTPTAPPTFKLGFATLAAMIPNIVGQPLENEHFNPANGDSLQRTTTGLMVWRKADNWTAFTNGYMTWINGPFGLQSRLNTDRFPWEKQ